MSELGMTAVAWICVTAMVLGVASCTWATSTSQDQARLAREKDCWDRGMVWGNEWYESPRCFPKPSTTP